MEDYKVGTVIGNGAYARVIHVRHRETGDDFALKVINKKFLIAEKQAHSAIREKRILQTLFHPGIVKLYFTFQDENNLYFGMNMLPGGSFIHAIQSKRGRNDKIRESGAFNIKETQFYMAELLQSLEYIHSQRIVHRDLKPENILLTAHGHIVVCDFGTAKSLRCNPSSNTFCGTATYMSPEVVKKTTVSVGADLWAFGCIVYETLTGQPCFDAPWEHVIFDKILKHPFTPAFSFPDYVPSVARNLVNSLIRQNPQDRLGAGAKGSDNDYVQLKSHPFFRDIDFVNIRQSKPPAMTSVKTLAAPILDWAPTAPSFEHHESIKGSWLMFLRKKEKVVMSGYVVKRRKFFKKRRMLLLTNVPRLLYIDTETETLKGTVPWGDDLQVILKTVNRFDVVTKHRIYDFEDCNNNAKRWQDGINHQIQNLYMNSEF